MNRPRAMTLLEVLVAVAILAILGVLAERGLSQMLRARDALAAETRHWYQVALTFDQVAMDVNNATPGDWLLNPAQDPPIRWQRTQGSDRSLSSVRYRVQNGALVREVEGVSTTDTRALASDVASVSWQVLDDAGNWQPVWPVSDQTVEAAPRALKLVITQTNGQAVERWFSLP